MEDKPDPISVNVAHYRKHAVTYILGDHFKVFAECLVARAIRRWIEVLDGKVQAGSFIPESHVRVTHTPLDWDIGNCCILGSPAFV